jgi:hypothetical protein
VETHAKSWIFNFFPPDDLERKMGAQLYLSQDFLHARDKVENENQPDSLFSTKLLIKSKRNLPVTFTKL